MTKRYTNLKRQLGLVEYKHMLSMDAEAKSKVKNLLTYYGYQEVITKHIDTLSLGDKDHIIYDEYVTANTLERLIEFDFSLRNIIRSSAERFELTLKAALIDAVSLEYGVKRSEYLDELNFRAGTINRRGQSSRDYLFREIRKSIGYSNSDLRPWEVINKLTLGVVATYYRLSDTSIKNRIINRMLSSDFTNNFDDVIVKNFFSDLIYVIHNFRNQSSHGGRVYDFAPAEENDGFKNADKIFTYIKPNDKQYSSNGLFPLMAALGTLKNNAPYTELNKVGDELKNIEENELTLFYYFLDVMNFPADFW